MKQFDNTDSKYLPLIYQWQILDEKTLQAIVEYLQEKEARSGG